MMLCRRSRSRRIYSGATGVRRWSVSSRQTISARPTHQQHAETHLKGFVSSRRPTHVARPSLVEGIDHLLRAQQGRGFCGHCGHEKYRRVRCGRASSIHQHLYACQSLPRSGHSATPSPILARRRSNSGQRRGFLFATRKLSSRARSLQPSTPVGLSARRAPAAGQQLLSICRSSPVR